MSQEMKFCKDCAHCPDLRPDRATVCLHERAGSKELYAVTGNLKDLRGFSCASMRAGICSNGRLWEARDAS